MRIALVVLFLLCGVGVFAEFQPVDVNKSGQHKKIDVIQKSDPKNQPTDKTNLPCTCNQATANGRADPDKTTPKQIEIAINERIARYTGFLALLALLQFIAMGVQAHFLRKTLRATKEAAEAAQKSAEALPIIERAHLFAEISDVDEAFPAHLNIILKISNEGKTPAIVTHVAVGLIEGSACPGDIKRTRNIRITKGGVIRGGGFHNEPISFDWCSWASPSLGSQGRRSLMPNTAPDLVLFGLITYKDIFKDTHTLRFCWHHDAHATREIAYFSQCNNNDANNYD